MLFVIKYQITEVKAYFIFKGKVLQENLPLQLQHKSGSKFGKSKAKEKKKKRESFSRNCQKFIFTFIYCKYIF